MNERATTVEGVRRTNLAEVLRLVHHSGPRSRAVITAETGLNRSTVSDLVGRLVEAGLVSKEPNPADARGSVIALTDEGLAELRAYRSTYAATVAQRLEASGHTTEELATAVALLRDLLEVSSEEGSK